MSIKIGPLDACTEKQKGVFLGGPNIGMVPAGIPPAIPVPAPVITTDTSKPKSGKTTKVKHEGKSFCNQDTVFKGIKGDEFHVGTLPPKSDIVSQTKCADAITLVASPIAKAEGAGMLTVGNPVMGNVRGKVGHTVGAWLGAGGAAMFSAKCQAALNRCGIDPDEFKDNRTKNERRDTVRDAYADTRIDEAKRGERGHGGSCRFPNGSCSCVTTPDAAADLGATDFTSLNSEVTVVDGTDAPTALAIEATGDTTEQLERVDRRASAAGDGTSSDRVARDRAATLVDSQSAMRAGPSDPQASDQALRNNAGSGSRPQRRRPPARSGAVVEQGGASMVDDMPTDEVGRKEPPAAIEPPTGLMDTEPNTERTDGAPFEELTRDLAIENEVTQKFETLVADLTDFTNSIEDAKTAVMGKKSGPGTPNTPSVVKPTDEDKKLALECIKEWAEKFGDEKDKLIWSMMNISGDGTPKGAMAVAAELKKMPTGALAALKDNNAKVVVCEGNVTDHYPSFKGKRPRGWPKGKTWEDVAGVYDPDSKEIVVATRNGGLAESGSANIVLHEAGHGVDDALGEPSQGGRFGQARDKDIGALSDYEKQPGTAGREETFAERMAANYQRKAQGDSSPSPTPNIDAYMDSLF